MDSSGQTLAAALNHAHQPNVVTFEPASPSVDSSSESEDLLASAPPSHPSTRALHLSKYGTTPLLRSRVASLFCVLLFLLLFVLPLLVLLLTSDTPLAYLPPDASPWPWSTPAPLPPSYLTPFPAAHPFHPHRASLPFLWPPSSILPAPSPGLPSPPPPPPPSISFLLRSYSGYRLQLPSLFRSMELFLPPSALRDVVVVLDDSEADRLYAPSLPTWVRVIHEGRPPLSDTWRLSIKGRPYDEALYSNWLSDAYSEAELLCTLDPDMTFVSRTALYSMLVWDSGAGLYRAVVQCLGNYAGYHESHRWFNLSHLPHSPYCMSMLPVCIHRSTLKNVRDALTEHFRAIDPAFYASMRAKRRTPSL